MKVISLILSIIAMLNLICALLAITTLVPVSYFQIAASYGILHLIYQFFMKEGIFLKKRNMQNCFVYCKCKNELCSSDSFVSDTYDKNGDNHVKYKCSNCKKESDWNFDIAPVAINWEQIKVTK